MYRGLSLRQRRPTPAGPGAARTAEHGARQPVRVLDRCAQALSRPGPAQSTQIRVGCVLKTDPEAPSLLLRARLPVRRPCVRLGSCVPLPLPRLRVAAVAPLDRRGDGGEIRRTKTAFCAANPIQPRSHHPSDSLSQDGSVPPVRVATPARGAAGPSAALRVAHDAQVGGHTRIRAPA